MSDHSSAQILIVDDSSTMRRIMRLTLGKCGYSNTEEAENGMLGLEKAKTKQFDCVISDWNMPEMTGVEMVAELRKLPSYASTPILMVTTEGGKEAVVEALQAGVSSFIVKPFTADVLRQKMDTLWGD
ncbi:MAG: response regulator [Kiritimatiellae bacterium]|nr:response regulator [Kiritimatiellia bacterium]MDD4734544.1 response regulator [Kiritimatiellia bacterium]